MLLFCLRPASPGLTTGHRSFAKDYRREGRRRVGEFDSVAVADRGTPTMNDRTDESSGTKPTLGPRISLPEVDARDKSASSGARPVMPYRNRKVHHRDSERELTWDAVPSRIRYRRLASVINIGGYFGKAGDVHRLPPEVRSEFRCRQNGFVVLSHEGRVRRKIRRRRQFHLVCSADPRRARNWNSCKVRPFFFFFFCGVAALAGIAIPEIHINRPNPDLVNSKRNTLHRRVFRR